MTTTLKALLQTRHLHSHTDFKTEYDRCAKQVDPRFVGNAPTKAQYYNWLSGKLQGLPRGHHCRVLEHMFPGWSAQRLFENAGSDSASEPRTLRESFPSNSVTTGTALEHFLGDEILGTGVTLVYPTFELSQPSRTLLTSSSIPRQHYFHKSKSPFLDIKQHRIDVPVALAENDIRALLYVSSVLQRHTLVNCDIATDGDVVAKCDRSFISFGLTSNDCTHMYLQASQEPLFLVVDDDQSSLYLEYLRLVDGTEFRSTDDDANIGLVLRIRPDPVFHPGRRWFFCAGLGPHGTAGAGWFLANNWHTLHELAGAHDFAAVITARSYSDQTAHLHHLYVHRPTTQLASPGSTTP